MSRGGPRFVPVPASRLLGELGEISRLVTEKGGRALFGQHGREVVFDVTPPGGRATVRVYTSLAAGAAEVRECGEDAVRLFVGVDTPERFKPLEESTKILRTAPKGAEDRAGVFLARLRDAIREAYKRAVKVQLCPLCGRAMALRSTRDGSRRFYGCIGYPECKGARRAEG